MEIAAEVFGFPTHNAGGGICWKCHCTHAEVTRALCNQFPHTNTFAGAKAPPYAGAKAPPRNVGAHVEIEKHKARRSFSLVSLGKTLCFFSIYSALVRQVSSAAPWRNQPISTGDCLYRMREIRGRINPIFGAPYVTPAIFRMDWLHVADQGITPEFIGSFIAEVIHLFPGSTQKERCASLYEQILQYYEDENVLDRFDKILPTFIFDKKDYKLKGSAAKVRALVPFIWRLAQEILDLQDPKHSAMYHAAYHLHEVYEALSESHPDPQNSMREHGVRFASLYVALHDLLNGQDEKSFKIKPKLHLFMHITSDNSIPRLVWTYRDEDFGGSVARMARRRGGVLRCSSTSKSSLAKFKIANPCIRIV